MVNPFPRLSIPGDQAVNMIDSLLCQMVCLTSQEWVNSQVILWPTRSTNYSARAMSTNDSSGIGITGSLGGRRGLSVFSSSAYIGFVQYLRRRLLLRKTKLRISPIDYWSCQYWSCLSSNYRAANIPEHVNHERGVILGIVFGLGVRKGWARIYQEFIKKAAPLTYLRIGLSPA